MPSLPLRILLQILVPCKQASWPQLFCDHLIVWKVKVKETPLYIPKDIRGREEVLPNINILFEAFPVLVSFVVLSEFTEH